MRDKSNSKEILITCSYIPEEIISAAGLIPIRIIPEGRPSEGDTHIHPTTCHCIKSLLASALSGKISKAGGIIFANSCNGMERLYDTWREYIKDIPALFVDVPKKKDEDSIDFFTSELVRFSERIENTFSTSKITVDGLREKIGTYNEVRSMMDEIFRTQRNGGSGVLGKDVFSLLLDGCKLDPLEFSEKGRRFISNVKKDKEQKQRKRIVLTGNVINEAHVIEIIEDFGAKVVSIDTCIGERHYKDLVWEESSDIMRALSERYLRKSPCPRMDGIEDRFKYLKDLACDSGADGIVYCSVKFCDFFLYDAQLIGERFKKEGVPFLFIENDYEWTGLEQIKTRIEAFLEVIK